jgi:hypothetical protein
MTRQSQIADAIKVIGPADRLECTRFVVSALDDIDRTKLDQQQEKDLASKSAKKALRAHRAALNHARVTYANLPDGMKQTMTAMAKTSAIVAETNFSASIDMCDRILVLHRGRVIDFPRIMAAAWAKNILELQGTVCSLTKKGKWPRLAAILHGSPKEDFYHHCSVYRAGPKLGLK